MNKQQEFEIANRAYELFTLVERERALEEFARLRYPSILDRFSQAVSASVRITKERGDR